MELIDTKTTLCGQFVVQNDRFFFSKRFLLDNFISKLSKRSKQQNNFQNLISKLQYAKFKKKKLQV